MLKKDCTILLMHVQISPIEVEIEIISDKTCHFKLGCKGLESKYSHSYLHKLLWYI